MKNLFYLTLITITVSCSSLISRNPASLGEYYKTFKHQFRFYNYSKYLPNSYKIYQRTKGSAFLKMEFIPSRKLVKNELICIHTYSKSDNVKKFKLDLSEVTTIDIDYFTDDIICNYKENEQDPDESQRDSLKRRDFVDVVVKYNFKYHELGPYNKLVKQKKSIHKAIQELQKNLKDLKTGTIQTVDGLDVELENTSYELNENQSEIRIPMVKGSKLKIKDITGEIVFGWGRYKKKIGPNGLPAKSSEYIAPNINKMAFICGVDKNGHFKVLQTGQKEKVVEDLEGDLVCKINHKKGYNITLIGKINFKTESVSKESVIKAVKTKMSELSNISENVQVEIEKEVVEKTKYYEQMLLSDINPLFKKSNRYKDSEPPKYCSEENENKLFELKKYKGQYMQKGGEWCSTPIEHNELYYSICDSRNLPEYHGKGRVLVFNKKNNKIALNTINPVDGHSESFNASKNIKKIVIDGVFKSFVITTYDGRILYINDKGDVEKEVKVDSSFLYNPMITEDGLVIFITREDPATIYVFDMDGKLVVKKHNPVIKLTASYQIINKKIVLGLGTGEILVMDFNLNEIEKIVVEKDQYVSDIVAHDGKWFFGNEAGNIFQYDPNNDELKKLYRIPHSGRASYNLSKKDFVEDKRSIAYAPIFFNDGTVAVLSHQDSRIHYFTADWKYRFAVDSKKVKANYTFDKTTLLDGSEGISITTTSYFHLFDKDGNYYARGVLTGSENMHSVKNIGPGEYMYGVSRGVYNYKLKEQEETFKTKKSWACD